MSQPAKSPRATAATDAPETTAGTRAAAQRLKMRRELAAAAMELFATKGYEATTVDEIAGAAGVARRTFFRHFRSKEEAIFPDHDDTLVRAEAVLNAAPAHEHPLDTVCRGIKEVMKMYAAKPAVSVARYKLTREVPTLREAEIASVARYERLFTRYLLGHFDERDHHVGNDDPLLAEVAASAVVTAHNHVLRRWLRAGGQGDVEAQLDRAFAIVRDTFGTGIGAGRTAGSEPGGASRSGRPPRWRRTARCSWRWRVPTHRWTRSCGRSSRRSRTADPGGSAGPAGRCPWQGRCPVPLVPGPPPPTRPFRDR